MYGSENMVNLVPKLRCIEIAHNVLYTHTLHLLKQCNDGRVGFKLCKFNLNVHVSSVRSERTVACTYFLNENYVLLGAHSAILC